MAPATNSTLDEVIENFKIELLTTNLNEEEISSVETALRSAASSLSLPLPPTTSSSPDATAELQLLKQQNKFFMDDLKRSTAAQTATKNQLSELQTSYNEVQNSNQQQLEVLNTLHTNIVRLATQVGVEVGESADYTNHSPHTTAVGGFCWWCNSNQGAGRGATRYQ